MNRFAIDEEDQFEIAAIQTIDFFESAVQKKVDKAMRSVLNLTKQQNKGLSYFLYKLFSQHNYILTLILQSWNIQERHCRKKTNGNIYQ